MSAPIAVTAGEPAGIGPEIVVTALARLLAQGAPAADFVVIGDRALLAHTAARAGAAALFEQLRVHDIALRAAVVPGRLDLRNAAHVLAMLDEAIAGARAGRYGAIVTAPLQKSVINDAGTPFTGHTEYLAAGCGVARVVMMLVGGGLRVALATTHLPLRAVADALTVEGLVDTLAIIDRELRARFRIVAPRIAVTGLNPHAGEGGHLGHEEEEVIEPALALAQARGIDARGPYPADTLFQPRRLAGIDCVLAMYHDQGLPVLKYASFGAGVNVTLGLPVVRTSVDHGTALDIAGTGRADCGSLLAALALARELAA